jgi:hypothetical protein
MDRKNIQLYKTLDALQVLRTTKNAGDSTIHAKMNDALEECRKQDSSGTLEAMLRRIMIHIGDVSRQHNILKKMGIKSQIGGAQERSNFRSLLRWWEKAMPESFYKDKTLEAIYEFTVAENLVYNEIRSDRKTGKILSVEYMDFDKKKIAKFISKMIAKGKDVSLWAKHLPKVETDNYRSAKKTIKFRKSTIEAGKTEIPWSIPYEVSPSRVKLNGMPIDDKNFKVNKEGKKYIMVKDGDTVSFPRKKQDATIARQKRDLEIAKLISDELNLEVVEKERKDGHTFTDFVGYKKLRKKQNTVQQKICSGEMLDVSKQEFKEMLNGMTAGTQFRVAKMIAYKDEAGNLKAKEGKWERLGEVYLNWVKEQEKVAEELRQAAKTGDVKAKEKAMKKFKVKTTGMQTIDMLAELQKGQMTDTEINNAYQSLIEKMDIIANVFVVIDGSGSMMSPIGGGYYSNRAEVDAKHASLQMFDVACTLAIALATRNPEPEFRNVFGWFSSNCTIVGDSKFIDESPNRFVNRRAFQKEVSRYNILSETNTFTQNLKNMKSANPGIVSSTNIMAIVEYFTNLVKEGKFSTEELPQAILIITDNEGNSGKSPREALKEANAIGWYPLLIFWGLRYNTMDQYKNIPNTLFLGGFNESNLSQILRGIKTGSINPEDELWSINDDPRYSVID